VTWPDAYGEAAVLGAARKGLDTPEGFHSRHYKLLVYTDYRNYRLHSLRWSLENKVESLELKIHAPPPRAWHIATPPQPSPFEVLLVSLFGVFNVWGAVKKLNRTSPQSQRAFLAEAAHRERRKTADSIEKVGFSDRLNSGTTTTGEPTHHIEWFFGPSATFAALLLG